MYSSMIFLSWRWWGILGRPGHRGRSQTWKAAAGCPPHCRSSQCGLSLGVGRMSWKTDRLCNGQSGHEQHTDASSLMGLVGKIHRQNNLHWLQSKRPSHKRQLRQNYIRKDMSIWRNCLKFGEISLFTFLLRCRQEDRLHQLFFHFDIFLSIYSYLLL